MRKREIIGNVGVVGLGSVGKAVRHVLSFYFECAGYDIDGRGKWVDILNTSVVLVCVDTPSGIDGHLDCSHVDDVLNRLSKSNYKGVVAVKSTVRIGYFAHAKRDFSNLRLVYFPEFLREKSTLQWTINPDRLILAGNKSDVDEVLSYFSWVENVRPSLMNFIDAELGKLAHNAYIATKVTFTNEMERISLRLGADPEKVMETVWSDRRVGSPEHLRPNLGPYDGKCVPKDTMELITSGDSKFLRQISVLNDIFTKEWDDSKHLQREGEKE